MSMETSLRVICAASGGKRGLETMPSAGSVGPRDCKSRRLAPGGMPSRTYDGETFFKVWYSVLLGIRALMEVELIKGGSGIRSRAVYLMADTRCTPKRALVYRLDTKNMAVVHFYSTRD